MWKFLRGGATVIPGATFIPESRVPRYYRNDLSLEVSRGGTCFAAGSALELNTTLGFMIWLGLALRHFQKVDSKDKSPKTVADHTA